MTPQHPDPASESIESTHPSVPRHRFRVAVVAAGCLGLGLACAAAEVAYTMRVAPWLTGGTGYYSLPADIWRTLNPARWVANGAVLFLYEASGPRFDYGPLWPVVVAPGVAIGDHLGLVDNSRHTIPRPTMAIPMIIMAVTVVVTTLAAATWRITAIQTTKARAAAIAAIIGPTMLAAGSWFHGEDIMLASFLLLAAAAGPAQAGVWMAAALLTKQTALAYAPVLFAACKPGKRVRFTAIAVGIPATVMVMIFTATPSSLIRGLTGAPTCADCFTPALWASIVWEETSDISATYGRVMWLLASVIAAWSWRHRCRDIQGLLVMLTFISLMRPAIFEAGVYAYYWVPAMIFSIVWLRQTGRHLWPSSLGFTALVAWHHATASVPLAAWWLVTLTIVAVIWQPVLGSLGWPRYRLCRPLSPKISLRGAYSHEVQRSTGAKIRTTNHQQTH